MYINTLKSQWENLCDDFYQDFDIIMLKGNNAASLNSWYSVRIHRWNSVAYSEGIILEQQNNPQLANAILASLQNFSFRNVDAPKAKSSWPGLIASAAVGVGATLAAKFFFDWKLFTAILTGAAAFTVCAVPALRLLSGSDSNSNENIKQEYLSQLRAYWGKLEAACRKFEES